MGPAHHTKSSLSIPPLQTWGARGRLARPSCSAAPACAKAWEQSLPAVSRAGNVVFCFCKIYLHNFVLIYFI